MSNAEFLLSATSPSHYPATQLPEIAFVGRSNVGKSSLLNALVNRKNLARISSTPGKTRQINFFRIDQAYHLVDLPGYGYAKVSKTEREDWRKNIEQYLRNREQLRLVVSLIDIRHDPTALDRDLLEWLDAIERPYCIVLTKADKVKPGFARQQEEDIHAIYLDHPFYRGIKTFSIRQPHLKENLLGFLTKLAGI